MSLSIDAICTSLAGIAPLRLAEDWDNVGLLIGDRKSSVAKVMTCLTVTPDVVDEAVGKNVDLLVSHHPAPFKPLAKITSDSVTGAMLLRLIGANVAVYSAHTAFDSAFDGINEQWTEALGLTDVHPLIDSSPNSGARSGEGAGRFGTLSEPQEMGDVVRRASEFVGAKLPRMVGDADCVVERVGFACGSGGTFLGAARRRGCDLLISGEATFHTCLEARSTGIGLGLLGHYFSERFAVEQLATELSKLQPELTVWPSESEHDPIQSL